MNSNDLLAPGLPPPDDDPRATSPSLAIVAVIGGLLVAALGFAVFGIGYGLGWWGHGDDAAQPEPIAVAEAKPDVAAPAAGPAFAGAELTPEVDPLAKPAAIDTEDRVLPGLEPVPEIEPPASGRGGSGSASSGAGGSGRAGDSGTASGGKSTGPRVSVTLVLGHYDHVDVKLGGTVLSLDADKTVKIRPGGYRIELRKSADAAWKPAGLVDIQVGASYRVTLFDPPFAKLEVVQ
jgi:hypothetical protein